MFLVTQKIKLIDTVPQTLYIPQPVEKSTKSSTGRHCVVKSYSTIFGQWMLTFRKLKKKKFFKPNFRKLYWWHNVDVSVRERTYFILFSSSWRDGILWYCMHCFAFQLQVHNIIIFFRVTAKNSHFRRVFLCTKMWKVYCAQMFCFYRVFCKIWDVLEHFGIVFFSSALLRLPHNLISILSPDLVSSQTPVERSWLTALLHARPSSIFFSASFPPCFSSSSSPSSPSLHSHEVI